MMTDEEKKAIESLKGKEISFKINWTPKQKATFEDVLGIKEFEENCIKVDILIKLINKLQKVIDLMAEELTEITGSCPLDRCDWENKKCDNCNNTYKKCFIEYFYKKVEEEND